MPKTEGTIIIEPANPQVGDAVTIKAEIKRGFVSWTHYPTWKGGRAEVRDAGEFTFTIPSTGTLIAWLDDDANLGDGYVAVTGVEIS